ncbi:MAG TPA: hypothetical protein DCZ10_02735 [Pelotomaculum sp.]|nr:hypothetical protein [Pelotomaculum sp.]
MSRSMPAGMYLPGGSCLHRLDPLIKLIGFMIFIVAVIVADSVWDYVLLAAFIGWMIALSGIAFNTVLGSIRRTYLFFLIIFFMNAFFFNAADPLWSWWIFRSLVGGMLIGRIAAGISRALIFAAGSYSIAAWTTSYFVTALPGIAIQLVLLPSIVFALERARLVPMRYPQ